MAEPESDHAKFHCCIVVLPAPQAAVFKSTGILRRKWFGNGDSVPVKKDVETARQFFNDALGDPVGAQALQFRLPLRIFRTWIDEDKMEHCPWVKGYRIRDDIEVPVVDPKFTLEPCE